MFEGAQDAVTQVSPDYCPPRYDDGYGEIPDWALAVTHQDALVYYIPGYSEYPYPLSTAPTNFFPPAFESFGHEYSPFRPLPLKAPPNNFAGSPQDFDGSAQSEGFGLSSPQHPVLHSASFPSSSYGSPSSSSYQSPETAVSPFQPWPVSPVECPVHHDSQNHQQTTAVLSPQPREIPGSTDATRPRAIENVAIADSGLGRTTVQSTHRQPTNLRRRRNPSISHPAPTPQLKISPKLHQGSLPGLNKTDDDPDLCEATQRQASIVSSSSQPEINPNIHQTSFPSSSGAHCASSSSKQWGGWPSRPPSSVTSSIETAAGPHTPTDLRTRNRFAANKCRAKSKAAIANLEEREREIAREREALKKEEHQLREQVFFLKEELFKHDSCGCAGIRSYLGAMAKHTVERAVHVPVDDSSEPPAQVGKQGDGNMRPGSTRPGLR